jgi:hypothetical protein
VQGHHGGATWLAARGKHDAVAVVLHRLLVDLSRNVDSTLRCRIVTLVRALQSSEWTAHALSFVRDFTLAASQADGWVLRCVSRRINCLHTHTHTITVTSRCVLCRAGWMTVS